jgi:hypothetical protein
VLIIATIAVTSGDDASFRIGHDLLTTYQFERQRQRQQQGKNSSKKPTVVVFSKNKKWSGKR